MRRAKTGRDEVTSVAGERVRAFVPKPLPPRPKIKLDGRMQKSLESAVLALGRLDSAARFLPDTLLFLYSYVRKEAVLSSQIEGTQSSLSDLLLFELEEVPGVPLDDVLEVSNYVAALEHGLKRIRGGFPISNRLIREIHKVLLSRGRGSGKDPGEFRRSQNWIGGTRPGNATFVPPPQHLVPDCMSALERFIHDEDDGLPILVRAGLAHVQFETIHPFLDGNGRVGRLLITLLLCNAGVLREPLLYLSLYLKERRRTYYDLLDSVRRDGDWERWLEFFIEGVRQAADNAVTTADHIGRMFHEDRELLIGMGRRAGSAVRVHDAMKARPLASVQDVAARSGLSFPAVAAAMDLLGELDIVTERTGRRRNRIFAYDRYLALLSEGTEEPHAA